jgi:NSS family neurotransmitter:Na+ symporter
VNQVHIETTTSERLRDTFSSRFAFCISTAGSSIGLGNIWKFPYVVGMFGGGAFLLVYVLFLLLVGFPAFLSEIIIGKNSQERPQNAFVKFGGNKIWHFAGQASVLTGFLVSAFYSVISGWIIGYFFEAILGNLTPLFSISLAYDHYTALMQDPFWAVTFHGLFSAISCAILLKGVRSGIEKCNRLFMPLFFVLLSFLGIWALSMPTAGEVALFMTTVDTSSFSVAMVVVALGHSFFTLSAGQGTLVTFGSYLHPKEKIFKSALFVLIADTLVSLIAAFIVLNILFSADMDLDFGPELFFITLPTIFSQLPAGQVISSLFFFLIFVAAVTSQISVLEPVISEVMQKQGIGRKQAAFAICLASFAFGVPAALPAETYSATINPILELLSFSTTSLLIPLSGLSAVLLIGWRSKLTSQLLQLERSERLMVFRSKLLSGYLHLTIEYTAPILITLVFLHAVSIL